MNEAVIFEEMETAESIAQKCGYVVGSVRNVIAGLGFSRNGVKTVLTPEQAEAVKRRLLAGVTHAGNAGVDTFISDMKADPTLELAALYARIDEIKSARIAMLEAENTEQAERLSIAEPKADVLDKITAGKGDVSVRELAAILAVPHLGQNNLFKRLQKDGYVDNLNRPYRQYVEAGIMYEKEFYVPQLDATKRQLRITQKGVAYFAGKYAPSKTA
jgi:phage antirepressor YoqD-like protein